MHGRINVSDSRTGTTPECHGLERWCMIFERKGLSILSFIYLSQCTCVFLLVQGLKDLRQYLSGA